MGLQVRTTDLRGCWFGSFIGFVGNKNIEYHRPFSFEINIDSDCFDPQGCVAMCCTSFHTADTPALTASWWTPGATSPATPAIASRGNTRAPVSTEARGVAHSRCAQVHIEVLFFRHVTQTFRQFPVFHYSFINSHPCVSGLSRTKTSIFPAPLFFGLNPELLSFSLHILLPFE